MKDWLKTYGWRFLLAFIVAALAFAYIVHAERVASGLGLVTAGPAQRADPVSITRSGLGQLLAV